MPLTGAAATNAAASIGENLAGWAAGPVGRFAFGQLLSATGVTTDQQGAMKAELDQIVSALAALKATIDGFMRDMQGAISQLSYDGLVLAVSGLISKNGTLGGYFQDLAGYSLDNTAGIEGTKSLIRGALDDAIGDAPDTWHNAICGNAGTTGLIEAWSQVVHVHNAFFGPTAAGVIQSHWRYLDAQQAQSIMYCVEKLNDAGDHDGAKRVLTTWRTHRQSQLALLRGMLDGSDSFTYTNDDGTAATVTAGVNALPPHTTITTTSGAPMMYCLVLTGPNIRGTDQLEEFNTQYPHCGDYIHGLTGISTLR